MSKIKLLSEIALQASIEFICSKHKCLVLPNIHRLMFIITRSNGYSFVWVGDYVLLPYYLIQQAC